MGAGGSAQAHTSDGAPAYHVTHKGRDQLLVLCTEYVEIRNYDGTGPKIKISLFDIASWTSSPSKFVLNISRTRPGKTLEKGTLSMATLEAAAIAGRVGGAARQLQGKMAKYGVPDKDVRAQMKSMKEEVSLEQLRTYTNAHKFTSIQARFTVICCVAPFLTIFSAGGLAITLPWRQICAFGCCLPGAATTATRLHTAVGGAAVLRGAWGLVQPAGSLERPDVTRHHCLDFT